MDGLSTEVLIIGAGAAGLRAAIACREAGAEALVVAKSPLGLGTATILSGGGLGAGLAGCSPDEHRAGTLKSGREINQVDLVDTPASEAPRRIEELIEWGMKASISPGMVMAHGWPPAFGRELIRCLVEQAEKTGFSVKNIYVLNERWCMRNRTEKVGRLRESLLVFEK